MAYGRTVPLLLALLPATLIAQTAPGLSWDNQARVTIPGSVHRRLAKLTPVRPVDPSFPMERMILVLKMDPAAKASLEQLLKDQQNPQSPSYHQWLTPDTFGKRFGPGLAQVNAASLWLLQQGFTIENTARSGLAITFSGTAAQVGKAFNTAIMEYQVNGETHRGNATDISIPQGLAGFVHGVASLNDFRPKAKPRLIRTAGAPRGLKTHAVDAYGNTFIGPADFATIYNLAPLFTATQPIDGTGITIGIVGQTDLDNSDWGTFRSTFGLTQPGGKLDLIYPGADPGISLNDQGESSLDTQWASAAAPGATIKLVISPSSATTGGVDLSAEYLVDNNLAPIISDSYGACEVEMGSSYAAYYEQLWAQAAGQGISVFVSAGDSGAAGCDDPDNFTATKGKGVSGLSSTPFNTCVGGTMFSATGSPYWAAGTTQTNAATALQYVPETAWNECVLAGEYEGGGQRILGGGGGASTLYSKPDWQNALGVPADGVRDVPDIAFNAGVFTDPTAVIVDGQMAEYGGTSVATPCMAGIMALVLQSAGGTWQGNANPTLYSLGKAQYAGTGPAIFHDITTGNNSVPGLTGFAANAGYDQVTGLGSLNAQALVKYWVPGANPITVTVAAPTGTFTSGGTVNFSGSATDTAAGATLTYSWSFGDSNTAAGSAQSYTYNLNGPQAQTFQAHLTVTDQYGNAGTSPDLQVPITYEGVSVAIAMPVTNVSVMPTSVENPNVINFTAGPAATSNAGATIAGGTYLWQIYNPESLDQVYSNYGTTASFAFPGGYDYGWPVSLTVTDSAGNQGMAYIYVFANSTDALDQNGDGAVDVRDLLALASYWGNVQATASALNGLWVFGDLNADGVVNDIDLNLWLGNFTPVAP